MYSIIRNPQRSFLVGTLLCEALLIFSTWPLWAGSSEFPAVPCLSMFSGVPLLIDRAMTIILLTTLVIAIATLLNARSSNHSATDRTLPRGLAVGLLTLCTFLVLLNQHRLQPWHWLFMIVIAQTQLPDQDRCRLWKLTFASVYIFAGLSRIGPHVAEGMSLQVLKTSFEFLSLEHLLRNDQIVFSLCLTMSLLETGIGLLLLRRREKTVAVVAAVVVHLVLLFVLGPFGLGHEPAVLVWNGYFAVAVPFLFLRREGIASEATNLQMSVAGRMCGFFVMIFPLTGLFGIADNWISWQLYSPRPEVLRVFVRQDAVDKLPPHVRPFIDRPAPLDDWCLVRLDRWSLAATGAPIYPEDRFQLAMVLNVIRHLDEDEVRGDLIGPTFPKWWHRDRTEHSKASLNSLTQTYSFNASASRQPR